jgi:hypothetical protein
VGIFLAGDFSLRVFVSLKHFGRNDRIHKVLREKGLGAQSASSPFSRFLHHDLVISTTFSTPVEKGGEISSYVSQSPRKTINTMKTTAGSLTDFS